MCCVIWILGMCESQKLAIRHKKLQGLRTQRKNASCTTCAWICKIYSLTSRGWGCTCTYNEWSWNDSRTLSLMMQARAASVFINITVPNATQHKKAMMQTDAESFLLYQRPHSTRRQLCRLMERPYFNINNTLPNTTQQNGDVWCTLVQRH